MSNIHIAKAVFERIKASNSHLNMEIENKPEHVDHAMNINRQPGLDFDVFLNLQNHDELHLLFQPFWGEWFPCTEPKRVEEYEAAVNGVLSGEYRTKVINRKGVPVKGLLQRPNGSEWVTVFTWGKLHFPFGKKTVSYVQNTKNT